MILATTRPSAWRTPQLSIASASCGGLREELEGGAVAVRAVLEGVKEQHELQRGVLVAAGVQLAQEPLRHQDVPRRRAVVEQCELERGLRDVLVRDALEPAGELRGRERRPALDEADHPLLRADVVQLHRAQERVQRVGGAPAGEEGVGVRARRGDKVLQGLGEEEGMRVV